MIFAKIDYLNLLPFYVFIKQNLPSTQAKQIIQYKKSYPSKINKDFKQKRVNGAFISSIKSKRCRCLDIGIVAKNEVYSVLLREGNQKNDSHSDTSNHLAKLLNLKGEVLIGDKALRYYYDTTRDDSEKLHDLALIWRQKYNLPFVFARLCLNKKLPTLEKLAKKFVTHKIKIPSYILKQNAR